MRDLGNEVGENRGASICQFCLYSLVPKPFMILKVNVDNLSSNTA